MDIAGGGSGPSLQFLGQPLGATLASPGGQRGTQQSGHSLPASLLWGFTDTPM